MGLTPLWSTAGHVGTGGNRRARLQRCIHLFLTFSDMTGFDSTPTIFDMFQHKQSGFNSTPPLFNVFQHKCSGSTPPHPFSTCLDTNVVDSTPFNSFSMCFDV